MTIQVTKLMTEYAENPLGLGSRQPRLSWKLASSEKSQYQTAYRIIISSTEQKLAAEEGDLWDSGRVDSDQSVHVRYAGKALESGMPAYWKVCVWDKAGKCSPWSEPAYWSMGLLETEDWQAEWIGMHVPHSDAYSPVAYMRKGFSLDKPVKRAVLYATALGLYELYLNGSRVGDHEFAPGWTDYNARIQVQTFDVTKQIRQSGNVLGAMLGTGWYGGKLAMMNRRMYGYCPYFLLQLQIEYMDGTTHTVVSDETWKTSEGPLVYSEIFRGERYDARKELTGWLEDTYDDSAWREPIKLPYRGDQYGGSLVSQSDPPVRATREIKPVSLRRTPAGTWIVDMGQNMVGRVRLTVQGPEGTEVTLHHAEILKEDGSLFTENLRTATPVDTYVLKGEGVEVYEPKFTFHGFQYVEVEGYPGN